MPTSAPLLVATRKGLFVLRRGPSSWDIEHAAFVGDNVSLVLPDRRDGSLYAALAHGHFGVKLHRSADGGRTFTECAAPAYPEKPQDLVDVEPSSGKPIPWTTRLIWSLEE